MTARPQRPEFSPAARVLLAAIACYLAFPFLETPIFGLSLSAPLFAFLAIELWLGRSREAWRMPWGWAWAVAAMWMGGLLSLAGNVLAGELSAVAADELDLQLRFGYWGLVFLAVAGVAARARWTGRLVAWFAIGVSAAAALRLFEAGVLGRWGLSAPKLMSQNDYGLRFSAFTPFLILAAIESRGVRRWAALGALAVVLASAAGNGSRSSWIGVAVGAILLFGLLLASGRLRLRMALAPAVAVLLAAGIAWNAPDTWQRPALERWRTLERLDTDKPFQTRLLLVEKGWKLFLANPALGVGRGRFIKENVELGRDLDWVSPAGLDRRTAHNAYVKELAETGLAGALPLAVFLAALALLGAPAAVRLAHRGETWAAASYAAFGGISIHFWTLAGLSGTTPWFLYGLTAGAIERARTLRNDRCM